MQRKLNGVDTDVVMTTDAFLQPLGYAQDITLTVASQLAATIPVGARVALIVAEAQDVRWRDDGTAPTAAVGMPLPKNTPFWYSGDLTAIQFIEQAASAKLNVSFYK